MLITFRRYFILQKHVIQTNPALFLTTCGLYRGLCLSLEALKLFKTVINKVGVFVNEDDFIKSWRCKWTSLCIHRQSRSSRSEKISLGWSTEMADIVLVSNDNLRKISFVISIKPKRVFLPSTSNSQAARIRGLCAWCLAPKIFRQKGHQLFRRPSYQPTPPHTHIVRHSHTPTRTVGLGETGSRDACSFTSLPVLRLSVVTDISGIDQASSFHPHTHFAIMHRHIIHDIFYVIWLVISVYE